MIWLQLLCGSMLFCSVSVKFTTEYKYTRWAYKGKHRITHKEFPWRSVTNG